MVLSLQIAIAASIAVLIIGSCLGIWLAKTKFSGQILISTLLNLPLVLPPSVVGYFLLILLGRSSPLKEWLGIDLLFTWQAGAIASAVVAMPIMVESTRAAIANVDPELESAALVCGASGLDLLWHITLPLAYRGILAGFSLSVARGLGEFGATLMVCGSIPNRTQTLPLAIYDAVQLQDYGLANAMVLLMTAIAFMLLFFVRIIECKNDD